MTSPDLESLTPRQRALLVRRLQDKRQGKKAAQPIPKRTGSGPAPVSFAQKRLWFMEQIQPHQSIYHLGLALRLGGALNIDALRCSLEVLVRRHESLRTRFAVQGGEPVQVVDGSPDVMLPRQRASRGTPETAEEILLREVERFFDLENGPLWRVGLVELGEDDHLFFFILHHIITDGWSQEVLTRELCQLYGRLSQSPGQDVPDLPELVIQYSDFAVWQHQWLGGAELARQLDYWRQQLKDLPTLRLPWDHARSTMSTYRGYCDEFRLPLPMAANLEAVCGATGATPFMVLTALLAGLLSRHGGQQDFAIGTPVAGRQRPELEPVVGFFVNMLVLRLNLDGGPRFSNLVIRMRDVALEAYAHQDLPFEKLVEELDPERELGRNPLFQTSLSVQNMERTPVRLPGLETRRIDGLRIDTRFDLEISAQQDQESGWWLRFVASSDLFDKTTLTRLALHGRRLLEGALASPDQKFEALSLLSIAEQFQLLEFGGVSTSLPEMTIPQLFEAQAVRRPRAIALEMPDEAWTYGEINRRANRLAHHLIRRGVTLETRVGLCLDRGLPMIVSLLAILKAGGTYVPIDPEYPEDRRAFLLQDSGAELLIDEANTDLDETDLETNLIETDPPPRAFADSLAYIIYTSGSTGRPKGVCVPHRGVVRLIHEVDYVDLGPREILLQLAPISFDASTFELWASLLHGARLVLFPPHTPSLEELGQTLETHRISILWLTSTLFQQMVTVEGLRLARVRQVLAGGEILPLAHVRRALQALPAGHRLINGYGPTENTTFTCCHGMNSVSPMTGSVPIGRPISHTRVHVVDRCLRPLPIGVVGELVTGGAGLARGYLNGARQTAWKFIPDALGGLQGARLYRTGDLACFQADGSLEFLGRADHQVKVRGFRIELGEIESVLEEHPAVARAVTVLKDSGAGDTSLASFWVRSGSEGDEVAASHLQAHLAARLPRYMVPTAFVALDELPLTPHGKVDRQALRRLTRRESGGASATDTPASAAARDALERQLVNLWEQVLKRNPIGVHDKFFELGGHSLLAIRLFALIEESFGQALPISTLFQAPTVAELAALLRDRGWAARWPSIVPIHPWGRRPPLFCVHGVTGDPFIYRNLVGHLPPDQPIYGLQARGMTGETEPLTRIEDMAAQYLAEIRGIQPQGPYFLGGFCFGGYTAFEIARQVLAQGEEVGLLALFDTPAPITSALPMRIFLSYRLRQLLRFGRHHVDRFRAVPRAEKLAYLRDRRHGLRRVRLGTVRLLRTLGLGLAPSGAQVDVAQANRLALRRFRPEPYSRAVTVFRSREFPEHGYHDPLLGWEVLAADVTIHEVAGDHHSMFDEPRVQELAALLEQALTQILEEGAS